MHTLPGRPRFCLVLASTLAAALAVLTPTGPAAAQGAGPDHGPGTISFDLRGGVVPTASDFADVTEIGASAGGGVAVKLTRQVALQADVDYELFSGARVADGTLFPDVTVVQATGGLELQFMPDDAADDHWTSTLEVGAGISRFETDETLDRGTASPVDIGHTGFVGRAATKLAYMAAPAVTVFLEPQIYVASMDRQATVQYQVGTADPEVGPFDVIWFFPVQGGMRLSLP